MVDLDHLSYSSLAAFQLCPLAWKFRYIDRIKTPTSPNLVFGSAMHETIEGAIRDWMPETPSPAIVTRWSENWTKAKSQNIAWNDENPEELNNLAVRMISHPDTLSLINRLGSDRPMIEIEKRITLSVPGVPIPIIGFVDIIGLDGVPYDLKTAGKSWTQEQAQKETQPTYYLAALNQAGYGGNPDCKFRHVVWVKSKVPKVQEFETTRSHADMLRLFTTIQQVWRSIQAEAFSPNTTSWKCSSKWCEFHSRCQGAHI